MSPIAIRQATRRSGRRLAGLLALFAVIGTIGVHHSGVAMGNMHHEGMGPDVLELCLGALSAIGATVMAVAVGILALGRWRVPTLGPLNAAFVARRPPLARARAGPPLLALLCVRRR